MLLLKDAVVLINSVAVAEFVCVDPSVSESEPMCSISWTQFVDISCMEVVGCVLIMPRFVCVEMMLTAVGKLVPDVMSHTEVDTVVNKGSLVTPEVAVATAVVFVDSCGATAFVLLSATMEIELVP